MLKSEHDVQECFEKLIKMVLAMDFQNEEFMHCLIHVVRYLVLRTLSDRTVRGLPEVREETILELGDAVCAVDGSAMIRDASGDAVLRFTLQMILERLLTKINIEDVGDFLVDLFRSLWDDDEDDESEPDDEEEDDDSDDEEDEDDSLIPG